MLDKYNAFDNLVGYPGRIVVILAGRDEVVPVQHGLHLYDSLAGDKKFWRFESATDNKMPLGVELDWWADVADFIEYG